MSLRLFYRGIVIEKWLTKFDDRGERKRFRAICKSKIYLQGSGTKVSQESKVKLFIDIVTKFLLHLALVTSYLVSRCLLRNLVWNLRLWKISAAGKKIYFDGCRLFLVSNGLRSRCKFLPEFCSLGKFDLVFETPNEGSYLASSSLKDPL